jgi:hypothetical protein
MPCGNHCHTRHSSRTQRSAPHIGLLLNDALSGAAGMASWLLRLWKREPAGRCRGAALEAPPPSYRALASQLEAFRESERREEQHIDSTPRGDSSALQKLDYVSAASVRGC